ncbi:MAG TPA: hypothetical protein VM779_05860 [Thermoanaerobaculia bacterium]|nr:hypothetical protein [Thermoanaerobaculia bacterium]
MKVRRLLVLTAFVSSILGAITVYLFLTVPNDLKADALLREARGHISGGRAAEAHDSLTRVIQSYPRTDAAAAATVALLNLEEKERERIRAELGKLQKDQAEQANAIAEMRKSLDTLAAAPSKTAAVQTPPKAPAKKTPTKKVTSKKTPVKKQPTRRKKR